jgi:hypothetical protein
MKIPLIFVHYGDSWYLANTLYYAKKYNPDKDIILIGDDFNKKYAIDGVKFIYYKYFDSNELLLKLVHRFKYIRGGMFYNKIPDKLISRSKFELFCFKRWIFLYYYLEENEIDRCWYFDSDTILLTDLHHQENKYNKFDCTEQSNGSCMKGLLSKSSLYGFSSEIIGLFDDWEYLENVRKAVSQNPDWAFCDMRAYVEYRKKNNILTIPLYEVNNDEVFDDALLQERNCEMMYENRINRYIKKLYFINNNVYIRNLESNNYIKLNCINFSWLPKYYIKMILYRIENKRDIPLYLIIIQLISYKLYLFLRDNIKFRFRNLK